MESLFILVLLVVIWGIKYCMADWFMHQIIKLTGSGCEGLEFQIFLMATVYVHIKKGLVTYIPTLHFYSWQ